MIPVQSKTIKGIEYDKESLVLRVQFIGDRIYRYSDVSPEFHSTFLNAKSKGKFFYANIRGKFEYQKEDGL